MTEVPECPNLSFFLADARNRLLEPHVHLVYADDEYTDMDQAKLDNAITIHVVNDGMRIKSYFDDEGLDIHQTESTTAITANFDE